MSWRLAKSLESLRKQINDAAPQRSKASDGTIGDPAHRKRPSDHNPDKHGIVRALDITHDPRNGVDGNELAAAMFTSRPAPIKYVIWDSRIMSGSKGPRAWQWRPYSGANPHDKHIHFSVLGGEPGGIGDRAFLWDIGGMDGDPIAAPVTELWPTLRRGDKGHSVMLLQQALARWGADVKPDADFGPRTEAAVKAYQKAHALVPDGVVGPYTWRALLA